jgi:hypothetical protein
VRRVRHEHFISHRPLVLFAKRPYGLAGRGGIAYPRTDFWGLRITVADGMLPLDRNLETSAGGWLKVVSSCKLAAAQPLREHGLQFRVQNVINGGKG